ncbi:MAG: hypothetical protein FJY81_00550 [Candidatus Aminicenantes bacterium]|nr:hypothetical protein [Candidatus Aminicenantes bacterium]
MRIFISQHTKERALERGTNKKEILEVLSCGFSIAAKYGRKGKARVYDFKRTRLHRFYEQKRVEVFYIDEDDDIIVLTVYVFYGKWE